MAGLVITSAALGALALGVHGGQLETGAAFWVAGLAASILPFALFTLCPVLFAGRGHHTEGVFA